MQHSVFVALLIGIFRDTRQLEKERKRHDFYSRSETSH